MQDKDINLSSKKRKKKIMCNNWKDNLDLFITGRIQESIKSLRSANEEYNDLCKHHAENSNKYQEIINSLNKENKGFIESFKDDIHNWGKNTRLVIFTRL